MTLHQHRYDGKEYNFRDDDQSSEQGREQIAAMLGLPNLPSVHELRFHLSFYSGGIGVLDMHRISMNADIESWSTATRFIRGSSPIECSSDKEWGEDFIWLVTADELFPDIVVAATKFINSERVDFQMECLPGMHIFFSACSDVNDWSVLWGTNSRLNYLAFCQG